MKTLKKLGVFLALLCLLGAGVVLLFWEMCGECVSTVRTGLGRGGYLLTVSDEVNNVYALSQENGVYSLVSGDQTGRRTGRRQLAPDVLPRESKPAALYLTADGTVFLGLYNTENDGVLLQLFRITGKGRTAELLLSEPCQGSALPAQMAGVHLSDFSEVDGAVTFAVIRENEAQFYRPAGSGLEQLQTVTREGVRNALPLPDGTPAVVTDDGLLRTDGASMALADGEIVVRLGQSGTGISYIDGAGLRVFRADFADWKPYAFLDLEKDVYLDLGMDAYDLDDITDLYLTQNGGVLMLVNGQRLLLNRNGTVYELSGMLYRPAWQCVLILAGLALGVLVLTTLLWYLLCEHQKLRVPMLLRWGAAAAAVAALAAGALLRLAVGPASRAAAERECESLLEAVSALQLQESGMTDARFPEKLGGGIAGTAGGLYRDTAVEVFRRDENGVWSLVSGNTGKAAGTRAELSPGFDRAQAEQAWQSGEPVFRSARQGNETHFILSQVRDGRLLCVDVGGEKLLEAGGENYSWMVRGFCLLAALLCALTILLLCRVTAGARRVARGLERLAAGERDVFVRAGGGDELGSLAEDVNILSRTMREIEERHNALARSYRRFVPERVLSLLGKNDLAEVDKRTFASRSLAAMTLSFSFPEEVYTSSGKDLFENVNEIIERTASIVAGKGGTVFNFSYDGYNAVFVGGSAAAVSTAVAVQQEVLEINREREIGDRPEVSVRIALDEGSVILGVVGDENQLAPTSVSTSFSMAKHLIGLCSRLEANILCTEAVAGSLDGYASRYMGKCGVGGVQVRTYEIFDGDPYELRKVKEQTGQRFAEGVYAMYSRDFSGAKSIFLSLVHRSAEDGGARYYLYLADQMEKRPEEEISLDLGM